MDAFIMRSHKIIPIFSLMTLLLQMPSVNAAVDYGRYRAPDPRGYDDPRGREGYDARPGYPDVSRGRELPYAQPAYNPQELQEMKTRILLDLVKEAKRLSPSKGFDANIAEYARIVREIIRNLSASPYRGELVKMLEAHKNTVIRIANDSYFLSEKMIFDSLGNGKDAEETPLQSAFRNGMRMSEDSFEQLRRMPSQAKDKLTFDRDYLKILLIQQLSDSHTRCGARRQCLAQDEKLMQDFKNVLPASLQFGAITAKYTKDLKEKSAKQSVLPIILGDIRNEMDPTEADALLKENPSVADAMVSAETEWAEVIRQEPGPDVIYPWVDLAAEEAKKKTEKEEADKIAKVKAAEKAAKKENKKSVIEKGTDDLKAQAGDQGKKAAQDLINGLFGGGDKGGKSSAGAGTAANVFSGLFK